LAYDVLSGVKVVELSMWAFVPSAGAVLADWGADVIKVVPVDLQDAMNGKIVVGDLPEPSRDIRFMWELLNRGKRSIGLNVGTDGGRDVLVRLLQDADIFLVNLLPAAQRRFRITPDDIRAIKPDIIYGRGTGQGSRGPDSERGGFDATSFWAGSGIGHIASQVADEFISLISPAFGDVISGFALASGVTAALLRRERTGVGAVVDASLLATGMYALSPSIAASELYGIDTVPRRRHEGAPNPLTAAYATRDGRYIVLASMRTDADWDVVCKHLQAPHLVGDPRFVDIQVRLKNRAACIQELDALFATRTVAEWREILADYPDPWTVAKSARETHTDPQVLANGYIAHMPTAHGDLAVVPSPIQFDEQPVSVDAAPAHAEHTDSILAELGYSEEEIIALKIADAAL
jgi:crotonobetainyl-CoA:carnitine CoA-transferase CaiB-like acyl-CoA transferase